MGVMKGLAAVAVLALVAAAVLVFAGCDGRADAVPGPAPTPEPTATPTSNPAGVTHTPTPTPEHYVRLHVVSDGSHDSLLLQWIGGPPYPTKWQYRRGVWRRHPDGEGCWTRERSGCWRRDDDGGRIWWLYFGAWTDIPGSGASTRSFRDRGLPAGSARTYQVRAVVGTVAAEASRERTGGTQEQGRQLLDIYASDVVVGDGQRRWLVLDFTIVIPDGVRVSASGASAHRELSDAYSYREGAERANLDVWGADSIVYGYEQLGELSFGPDGEVRHRYVPPAHAGSGAAVLDQIIASVRPHTP